MLMVVDCKRPRVEDPTRHGSYQVLGSRGLLHTTPSPTEHVYMNEIVPAARTGRYIHELYISSKIRVCLTRPWPCLSSISGLTNQVLSIISTCYPQKGCRRTARSFREFFLSIRTKLLNCLRYFSCRKQSRGGQRRHLLAHRICGPLFLHRPGKARNNHII